MALIARGCFNFADGLKKHLALCFLLQRQPVVLVDRAISPRAELDMRLENLHFVFVQLLDALHLRVAIIHISQIIVVRKVY